MTWRYRRRVPRAAAATVCVLTLVIGACSGDDSGAPTSLNRSDAVSLFKAGFALQEAGDLTGAIARYDKAIAANPSLDSAWYNRAVAKQNLERIEEAIADYRRAIELNPTNARALYNLGNLLIGQGQTDEGVTLVMRATELDPTLRGDSARVPTASS